MENNLTASEQLALLQPTATGSSGPTPEEKLMANIRNFTPPSVSGARAELNQVQNIIRDAESRRLNTGKNITPFQPGLSASQQFTRQRANQDKMISDAYARAGVPLSAADLSSMQSQVRQNPDLTEIDPTFLYEKRVADAYKSIGRTGDAVDKAGADYWLNKLKSGEISQSQFDDIFLKGAANYTGPDASSLLDSINKARTQLGTDPLTSAQLAAAQASGTGTSTTTTPGTGTSTATTPGTATQAEKDDLSKAVFGNTYIKTPGTTTPGTGISTITTPGTTASGTGISTITTPGTTIPGTTASGTGTSTTTSGPTRDQVLAAYAANPKAVLNPDEEAINFFMQPGKLANFNTIVDEVRAAKPELAASIDAERRIAASNPYQQYINPSVPTNPYQQYINPSVPTNPYQKYITTPGTGTSTTTTPGTTTRTAEDDLRDIFRTPTTLTPPRPETPTPTPAPSTTPAPTPAPASGPTRDQVLAAYAANPKAVLNPDEEAINFFMQPGNLGNFNTIVDQVRDANPELAASIDAERRIAASNPYQQYITTPGTGTSTITTPGTTTRTAEDDLRDIFRTPTTPTTPTPPRPEIPTPTPPPPTPPPPLTSITSSGPTREQVLAAYANNPKAVLNPDEAAIDFFMQPGNLGNFNTIVDQVRAADPALAARIDAERRRSSNIFGTLNQDQGLMRFLRNGGSVKK
jgi:hypothetical protein